MASYNLNEMLKKKEKSAGTPDGAVSLDDVSRVKVLSPGRQVFKRFIRNRLAVFGSVLLITMFVFSFLGPLFYPYGQKEIFYKYDTQNVNYALAKEITSYTGYAAEGGISVPRTVTISVNSSAKKLISADEDAFIITSDDGDYVLRRVNNDVFTLSAAESRKVASAGTGSDTGDSAAGAWSFAGAEAAEGTAELSSSARPPAGRTDTASSRASSSASVFFILMPPVPEII